MPNEFSFNPDLKICLTNTSNYTLQKDYMTNVLTLAKLDVA